MVSFFRTSLSCFLFSWIRNFDSSYFYQFLAFGHYAILYSTLLRRDPTFKKVNFKQRDIEHFFKNIPFYKKPLRSKQTSLCYRQFYTCTNHKKVTTLKLKRGSVLKTDSSNKKFHLFAKNYTSNRHLVWLSVLEKKIRTLS